MHAQQGGPNLGESYKINIARQSSAVQLLYKKSKTGLSKYLVNSIKSLTEQTAGIKLETAY